MSKYTTELRYICEYLAGKQESVGYTNVQEVINSAWEKIFDFDFPIFDENYKSVLCPKIIKAYYTREIGAETYGLWKLWLDARMNDIMPYYNQLYSSALLKFDPLENYKMVTEHEQNDDSTTTGETAGENSASHNETSLNTDLFCDTPQGTIDNIRPTDAYLSTARKISTGGDTRDSSTAKSTSTGKTQTLTKYLTNVHGATGASFSKLLQEYRDTFVNIDQEIIKELNSLFMCIW